MFASPVLFDLFVRVLPRSRARARANGLYLNLSGSERAYFSERLAWVQSCPIAPSSCTEAASQRKKGPGRGASG